MESELDRLQYALRAAGLGAWHWDIRNDAVWWSRELAQIFGIEDDAAPTTVAEYFAHVHPDDRAAVGASVDRAISTRGEHITEHRVIRSNGEVRWLASRGRVVADPATGEAIRIEGVVSDITERKRVDAELREREERFRSLVLTSADVVWTTDADGAIVDGGGFPGILEKRWGGFTGQSDEESQGYGWLTVVHPDDRERIAREWRRAVEERTHYESTYRVRRHDGVYRRLASRGLPVRDADGTLLRWVGTCTDVTDREEAEEQERFLGAASDALAASLNFETTLQDLAKMTVPAIADACVVDVLEPSGEIRMVAIHAEPATLAVLEQLRKFYTASPDRTFVVARVLTTGQPVLMPTITDERRREVAIDDEHLRLLRELGTHSNITVPLVSRGELLGALTLKRIHPEQPAYGPSDLAFAEELGRRAALALDNLRLLREARGAVRMRDEFLSSVSHDLKNPLTAIHGRVQLLQRKMARDKEMGPDVLDHGLDEIAQATSRLRQMIDELQDVSSLQIGRPLSLDRRANDLVGLAREVVLEARQISAKHEVRLEERSTYVVADFDRARLSRVLENLIGNAIKYSPDGGEVTVCVWQETIPANGASWACLEVRDRGVGIPAEELPRLFERFYRASNVTGRIAGSGIGLAGSRQIVVQHGGSITAESREGQGSAFLVRLPLGRDGRAAGRVAGDPVAVGIGIGGQE